MKQDSYLTSSPPAAPTVARVTDDTQSQGGAVAKHTPGPWAWSWETASRDWAIITGSSGRIIANVNTETGPCIASAPAMRQMPGEANARLIAAAPEMREALQGDPECPEISPLSWLKSAIDDLRERGPAADCDDPDAFYMMLREIEDLHRKGTAAIAKVEGRPMAECIYCRTTCNEGESPCQSYDAAERCAWFTESDRRALRVSDVRPEGVKTGTGLIEDDSAAASAETPHPSPVDYTEVVERLRADPYYDRKPLDYGLMHEAAQVIEAQAAEIERLKAVSADYHKSYLVMWPALNSRAMPLGGDNSVLTARLVERLDREQARAEAAEARIAELEKERDEERQKAANETLAEAMDKSLAFVKDKLGEIKAAKGLIGIYCDAFRAGWFSASRASEARLADAVKVIEDLMETGFNVAETPARQRARSFLSSTGGK